VQLSREELLKAYRDMRMIRDFEECLHVESAAGSIPGFVHLSAGEEASAVGVCMELDKKDAIAATHRGHGHAIAKGCDVPSMMKEIFGRRDGMCGGKGGSMHIADLDMGMMGANGIVGGGPPLVCGAALTAKTLKTGGVAVAFFGDGASNQGTVAEAMNLACVWELPVIFCLEDNGYGEATSTTFAFRGDQLKRAEGYGMPAVRVNGHDLFEVNEAMREATERARNGGGPSFIQCMTHRYYGHFEGDSTAYREENEIANVISEMDCLMLFRKRVTEAGLLEASQMDEIDQEVADIIAQAVVDAKASPPPGPDDLLTDVYVSY
jgi:acetoin:2,6-dichlorophenolindophenol oxidoreductase subunit alpha